MPTPEKVAKTRLWKLLSACQSNQEAISEIRSVAESLGRQVERLVPDFTDHSIRHMDSLWEVADAILTAEEFDRFTASEAFVLAAAFYVHDLGMAIGATAEGANILRQTQEYKIARERALSLNSDVSAADQTALSDAARQLHASTARDVAVKELPGLGQYLIGNAEMRESYGQFIGEISASHHWSLDEVHRRLGRRDVVPTRVGDKIDVGYIACVLRIVDYAHINWERATSLDRLLRSNIAEGSLVHWDAQTNISGPLRDGDQLVYGCNTPIKDIDAWWQFLDLATGLNKEIRSVRDYLNSRKASSGRFSLSGVRGIESPELFCALIPLDSDIAPIDVRVQPDSMDRVLHLLGGEAIYRSDRLAAIRELIQNARDAIALRNAVETTTNEVITSGRIEIILDLSRTPAELSIRDNGVGMTKSVVKNHLITVASDFWHSTDYARDFDKATAAGFRPIGRFGIGFLSVFMIGDEVEVDTERAGSTHVILRLRGVGRRGELRETASTGQVGTRIKIKLKAQVSDRLTNLSEVIRARAPMLPYSLTAIVKTPSGDHKTLIDPGWWRRALPKDIEAFVQNWRFIAMQGKVPDEDSNGDFRSEDALRRFLRSRTEVDSGWVGQMPEATLDGGRLVSKGCGENRPILICSNGIAVSIQEHADLFGLAEAGDMAMLPDRGSAPSAYMELEDQRRIPLGSVRDEAQSATEPLIDAIKPRIRNGIDELASEGIVPSLYRFLRTKVRQYGPEVLLESSLPWIPMIEPKGDLIHRTRNDAASRIASESKLIFCCGGNPLTAYEFARRGVTERHERIPGVALPLKEFDVHYDVVQRLEVTEGSRLIRGTLTELVAKTKISKRELVMCSLLLRIVAESWNTREDAFNDLPWNLSLAYQEERLWTILVKP